MQHGKILRNPRGIFKRESTYFPVQTTSQPCSGATGFAVQLRSHTSLGQPLFSPAPCAGARRTAAAGALECALAPRPLSATQSRPARGAQTGTVCFSGLCCACALLLLDEQVQPFLGVAGALSRGHMDRQATSLDSHTTEAQCTIIYAEDMQCAGACTISQHYKHMHAAREAMPTRSDLRGDLDNPIRPRLPGHNSHLLLDGCYIWGAVFSLRPVGERDDALRILTLLLRPVLQQVHPQNLDEHPGPHAPCPPMAYVRKSTQSHMEAAHLLELGRQAVQAQVHPSFPTSRVHNKQNAQESTSYTFRCLYNEMAMATARKLK